MDGEAILAFWTCTKFMAAGDEIVVEMFPVTLIGDAVEAIWPIVTVRSLWLDGSTTGDELAMVA